jgi:hypothetical protein
MRSGIRRCCGRIWMGDLSPCGSKAFTVDAASGEVLINEEERARAKANARQLSGAAAP